MRKTKEQKALLRKYNMVPMFWVVISEAFNASTGKHRIVAMHVITREVMALEN